MKNNVIAIFLLLSGLLSAQNLLTNGDFSNSQNDISPECRSFGGVCALVTEELNWNKCGKLTVDKYKHKGSREIVNCAVIIGESAGKPGFDAKAKTSYRFAFQLKGTAYSVKIRAAEFEDDDVWYRDLNLIKTTSRSINVTQDWTQVSGKFTTGENVKRAALFLQIYDEWEHGNDPVTKTNIGDYFMFDNIVIEEAKELFQPSVISSSHQQCVVATEGEGGRLQGFRTFPSGTDLTALIEARISCDQAAFYLSITAHEPLSFTPAVDGQLWSGDVIEIFFGPKSSDRAYSQFVLGPDGTRFHSRGDAKNLTEPEWTVLHNTCENGKWICRIQIPYPTLGWSNPEDGDEIPFNFYRVRKAAKEKAAWSPVRTSFNEVANFGRLIVRDQARADAKAAERFQHVPKLSFLVKQLHGEEDFSVPFLPDAVATPSEKFELSAAVNEIKPLPLAIANLSGKIQEYRVIVETVPSPNPWFSGEYGLAGFPQKAVTVRYGLRVRDSAAATGQIIDPLPRINEASTLTIPPGEAGLLWIDFDTTGVKPGRYTGRLRVIPLGQSGKFDGFGFSAQKYIEGEMTDFPLTLEVRNIALASRPGIPAFYCTTTSKPSFVEAAVAAGCSYFRVNPYSFRFPQNEAGDIEYADLPSPLAEMKQIRKTFPEAKYYLEYSAYKAFQEMYRLGSDLEQRKRLWPQWVRALAVFMEKNAIPVADYVLEISDEPRPEMLEELVWVYAKAREAAPKMSLDCTLVWLPKELNELEKLSPYVTHWRVHINRFLEGAVLPFLRRQQENGAKICLYSCETGMHSSLSNNYRRVAWYAEYYGLDYYCIFQFSYSVGDRVDWKTAAEGNFTYHSFADCVPSLRYMAVRQAATDLKYIAFLRSLNHPDGNRFLEKAAKRVVVDSRYDSQMPDLVREEAAQLILYIQSHPSE